ncbi:hypothetical protein [Marinoscillum luteum]|uniref:Tissue inhibitor of metalloproteinase n=1 Tax=Marinoscillum luteum TaxID=861051 RepID=A0ABW7NEY7_9BACT
MIKSTLIIFFINIGQILMACDCAEFTQEYEQNNSDMIFLGKIIESNSEYYTIEVLEVFKNHLSSRDSIFKIGINSCSISTTNEEVWLVYGQFENGNLEVSSCGYSKSLTFFNQSASSKILPPRPLNYTREEEEIVMSIHNSKVASQLYFTINGLRLSKLEKMIKNSSEEDVQKDVEDNSGFYISALVLAALNLIILIFLASRLSTVERTSRKKP